MLPVGPCGSPLAWGFSCPCTSLGLGGGESFFRWPRCQFLSPSPARRAPWQGGAGRVLGGDLGESLSCCTWHLLPLPVSLTLLHPPPPVLPKMHQSSSTSCLAAPHVPAFTSSCSTHLASTIHGRLWGLPTVGWGLLLAQGPLDMSPYCVCITMPSHGADAKFA
jgi:hypothetical protein